MTLLTNDEENIDVILDDALAGYHTELNICVDGMHQQHEIAAQLNRKKRSKLRFQDFSGFFGRTDCTSTAFIHARYTIAS